LVGNESCKRTAKTGSVEAEVTSGGKQSENTVGVSNVNSKM